MGVQSFFPLLIYTLKLTWGLSPPLDPAPPRPDGGLAPEAFFACLAAARKEGVEPLLSMAAAGVLPALGPSSALAAVAAEARAAHLAASERAGLAALRAGGAALCLWAWAYPLPIVP